MAQVAPGLGPEHNEPPCYNCGVRGHLFTACPEEPRKVPAGLEASWARQHSSNSPHNDNFGPNKRGKGPVITRYPPPPSVSSHQAPPIPRFENAPPQPYPSGPIPGYPPPPSYSPGFGGHLPPSTSYDRYRHPGPPPPVPPVPPSSHQPLNPPSYHNAYTNAYGPPGPVHGPYDPPHVLPSGRPAQYFPSDYPPGPPSRPEQYPPSQYPPGPPGPPPYATPQQFPPNPPPSYPPPPSFIPPPAPYGYHGPPPGYQQSEYNSPQREPPPAIYHQYPPPDPPYTQSYGDDRDRYQRGRGHQRRYDDRRSGEGWHPQDAWHSSPPSNDQPYRDDYRDGWPGKPSYRDDRHQRRRGHGRPPDERRRDRHDRFQPYKNSDKWDRQHRRKHQPAKTPSETTRRERNSPGQETPATVKTDQDREPGEIVSESASASDHGGPETAAQTTPEENSEEFNWDERTIFQEAPLDGKVDPIAAPLPTQYSEDVMIPPAFDAKSLKSRYITPRNVDDFAQSIRETRDWQVMQHHPTFLDPTEISLEKLDEYNRAVQKDIATKNNRRDRPGNSHDPGRYRFSNSKGSGRHQVKNQDPRFKSDQRKRRWNDFQIDAIESNTEKRYRDSPQDPFNKRLKPTSPEPGEVIEADIQQSPYTPSKTPTTPTGDFIRPPEASRAINSRVRSSDMNNRSRDSNHGATGYRANALPPDNYNKANVGSPMPSRKPVDTPQQLSRPSSRQSSGSFRKSHPDSRRSSLGSQISDSQGSPLDSIDRELLGLGRPSTSGSDSGGELPKRQHNDITPKLKRRQPMVEAYSRRW